MLTCSYTGRGQTQFTSKNKGFTLIELLAVIVILAIIAVIATPIITGIIESAKKEAFVRSVEGLLKGAEEVQLLKEIEGTPYTELVFDFSDASTLTDLSVSGKLPTSGIMRINKDGEKTIVTNNGTYCARKNIYEDNIEVFKYNVNTCKEVYKESILNGGYPILDSKMTAIYYDGTTPKVANVTSTWYSYQNRLWARQIKTY